MQLLRRQHREAVREIEPHLVTEDAERAGAGAVLLADAALADRSQQIEVLPHRALSAGSGRGSRGAAYSRRRYAMAMKTMPSTIIGADRSCPRVSQSNAI